MPVQEILPNIYRMEIPLPKNPLRALNSYVIKSPDRNLVVDTAMNLEECRNATYQGLAELDVDLARTDFFLTHMHADHAGLVGSLASNLSKVYCSQVDANSISLYTHSPAHWDSRLALAKKNGFPTAEMQEGQSHPTNLFSPNNHLEFTIIQDGYSISIGDYHFICVASPGHTRGHTCLYAPDTKLLISGDLILDQITPNITQWMDEGNFLKDYLESLQRVDQMEINLVLPGHRSLIKECHQRIDELIKHHRHRLDEVLSILDKGSQNGYEVASQMAWDMTFKSWEQFPEAQKWFATGEALSHLKYLEKEGLIRKEMVDEIVVYSPNN